jgi:hypothetical protein
MAGFDRDIYRGDNGEGGGISDHAWSLPPRLPQVVFREGKSKDYSCLGRLRYQVLYTPRVIVAGNAEVL